MNQSRNRARSILSSALIAAASLGAFIAVNAPTDAYAQEVVVVYAGPPDAYVATATPEYFGGRPVYWYNNAWYYRDGAHWSYYRSEPGYLRDRRSHWAEGRGHEGEHARYHYRR